MSARTSQRNVRYCHRAATLLFVAFAVWPPIQMFLSCTHGFSSWRFGGWGMYATPDPVRHAWVHVVPSAQGRALGRHARLSVGDREHLLEPLPAPSARPSPEALAACRRVQVLNDAGAARTLLALATVPAIAPERAYGAVLRIQPRLDLLSLRSYDEIDAFRVREDGVSRRRFGTDEPGWRAQLESFVE